MSMPSGDSDVFRSTLASAVKLVPAVIVESALFGEYSQAASSHCIIEGLIL